MRVTFVQHYLSIHQSALIRLLANSCPVTLLVENAVAEARKQQGWHTPDFGSADVCVGPDDRSLADRIHGAAPDTVFILGGIPQYPLAAKALQHCLASGSRIGLMTEAADHRGLAGVLRQAKYACGYLSYGKRFDFILAMGSLGVRWFHRSGYPGAKLFPFGYFTEPVTPTSAEVDLSRHEVHIAYVGQCIPRKGVDLLLYALHAVRMGAWQLAVIGNGVSIKRLQVLAAQLGIGERVSFLPSMPNQMVRKRIAESDLLVLPSRYDGWGAVVNEALMCGTPVICSDACGASDLVCDSWRGEVFAAESAAALGNVLRRWVALGPVTPQRRERIAEWSTLITGKSAAAYLVSALNHVYLGESRPVPPWAAADTTVFT